MLIILHVFYTSTLSGWFYLVQSSSVDAPLNWSNFSYYALNMLRTCICLCVLGCWDQELGMEP
jgi:hypothetical protein